MYQKSEGQFDGSAWTNVPFVTRTFNLGSNARVARRQKEGTFHEDSHRRESVMTLICNKSFSAKIASKSLRTRFQSGRSRYTEKGAAYL
jgi:hypothetical protein